MLMGYVGLSENGMGHYKHIRKRVGEGEVMLRGYGEESPAQTDTDICLCVVHLRGTTKSGRCIKTNPKG